MDPTERVAEAIYKAHWGVGAGWHKESRSVHTSYLLMAQAAIDALQLTEEWGNTWMGQGPAINRTRAEAERAIAEFRKQFPDHDHHHVVVSRLVGPWVEGER